MIAIRYRNHLAKDFFLAIEVDFEKKNWWGVGRRGEMIGIMRVRVCVCCCRYVLDMARVRHIVPDPSDDNLRLVIFSDLVTDICMLLLLLEPEFECRIKPCSLLRERDSPNFLSTSFHRCCGI
jgi:hypothetical protein